MTGVLREAATLGEPKPAGFQVRASGADAVISIDTDAAGPNAPRSMLLLKNLSCGSLSATNFVN